MQPLCSSMKEEYRACPTCNMQVNKAEGCNAVKCMCGTEFCWLCGEPCNETVHFLPHKPCSLFKKGKMKARHRLRTYVRLEYCILHQCICWWCQLLGVSLVVKYGLIRTNNVPL